MREYAGDARQQTLSEDTMRSTALFPLRRLARGAVLAVGRARSPPCGKALHLCQAKLLLASFRGALPR